MSDLHQLWSLWHVWPVTYLAPASQDLPQADATSEADVMLDLHQHTVHLLINSSHTPRMGTGPLDLQHYSMAPVTAKRLDKPVK